MRADRPLLPANRAAPKRTRALRAAVLASFIALGAAAPAMAQDTGEQARATLRRMSDYLADTPAFMMQYTSTVEVISHGGQTAMSGLKLQFGSYGAATVKRPNMIRASRTTGFADIDIISDGKTLTLYGRKINAYAQAGASPNLDMLIDDVRDHSGIAFSGADLLMSDVYKELTDPVEQAHYLGQDVVDGITCDHLAFRTPDVDWQIWIQVGEKPIPRKYIITSKWTTGAPQYELRITGWNDKPEITADTFAFKPPAGARTVGIDQIEGAGDLPGWIAVGGR